MNETKENSHKQSHIEKFFSKYKNTLSIVSGLIILVTFFITADDYINNQIENKITDESYINKLSKTLRPFSIFNEEGAVSYDHGGLKYIKNITFSKNKHGNIDKILLDTSVFLQAAPIISYVGSDNYSFKSTRINTYRWEYKVGSYNVFTDESATEQYDSIWIIEILK